MQLMRCINAFMDVRSMRERRQMGQVVSGRENGDGNRGDGDLAGMGGGSAGGKRLRVLGSSGFLIRFSRRASL